jgi:hypothetical protein
MTEAHPVGSAMPSFIAPCLMKGSTLLPPGIRSVEGSFGWTAFRGPISKID